MEISSYRYFYALLTVALTLGHISGELCSYPIPSDPCVCQTSTFTLNLTGFMSTRPMSDLSISGDIDYMYYIQPCNKQMYYYNYECYSKNPNLVSCQVSNNMWNGYGLGLMWGYDATKTEGGFILTNSFVDPYDYIERKLRLTILCSDTESFVYHGQEGASPLITYAFTVLTKSVCVQVPSVSISVGISPGSVMLILFFVLLIVYLVGGVLFLKYGKKAEGTQVIPNYNLWSAIPSLIKGGFVFTFSFCRKGKTYDSI